MRKLFTAISKVIGGIIGLAGIYLATLCFPQPFFGNKLTYGQVTVYANTSIPKKETEQLIDAATAKIRKSAIYKNGIHYNVFIVNNPWLWRYFSNINHKAAGLDYVIVNNIFFRKADIIANQVYGNSGPARGDRTMDYFLAHEMTHSLEFYSMPWYTYPLTTNWVLEGYSEYIGHNSETYEEALNRYLHQPENTGEKYYTRARTMISYLLEKENLEVSALFREVDQYDSILKRAIPDDKPNMDR